VATAGERFDMVSPIAPGSDFTPAVAWRLVLAVARSVSDGN
jgi:hypothetical protein